jgi:hypothetical protein
MLNTTDYAFGQLGFWLNEAQGRWQRWLLQGKDGLCERHEPCVKRHES